MPKKKATKDMPLIKFETVQEQAARTHSSIAWTVLHRRNDAMPVPPKLKGLLEKLGFVRKDSEYQHCYYEYTYALGEKSKTGDLHACILVKYQRRGDVSIRVWLGSGRLDFHSEKSMTTTLAKSYAAIEQVYEYANVLNNTVYAIPAAYSRTREEVNAHEKKFARRVEKVEGVPES